VKQASPAAVLTRIVALIDKLATEIPRHSDSFSTSTWSSNLSAVTGSERRSQCRRARHAASPKGDPFSAPVPYDVIDMAGRSREH